MELYKLNILLTDIIPIVNYAWARSFNNIETNIKAIRGRGWGPLNRLLIQHLEIVSSRQSPDVQSSQTSSTNEHINSDNPSPSPSPAMKMKVEIQDINFNSGYAGEVIQSILKKAQRDQQMLHNI